MVTHDLPYALELCARASVVLDDGQVVADGTTYDLLTDAEPDARATGSSCRSGSTRRTTVPPARW